ncbi:DedA family protein [Streptomyces sp. cg2]|uniref:DedA family protein n=1 Tax=Streptomyces sp. cg2 TaxID=3238799 RepID=UPI0034E19877
MAHVVLAVVAEHNGGLAGIATTIMEKLGELFGGPGAGIANALDSIFPFLPSEVILPLAGVSAGQGHMTLASAIFWTTLGSIVGSQIMYYIGMMLGQERMRALAAKIPFVNPEEIDRTEAWFAKHGVKAVFFGRMVPVFRSLISIPAGIERIPVAKFIVFTGLGSLIWNTIFVVAGYKLGQNWQLVEQYAGILTKVVVGVVVLAMVYFVVTRVRRRQPATSRGRHSRR